MLKLRLHDEASSSCRLPIWLAILSVTVVLGITSWLERYTTLRTPLFYIAIVVSAWSLSRGAEQCARRRGFRSCDFLAPKHGFDALAQSGFLGESQQQLESFVGDATLRLIQVEARSLGRHALTAFPIVRKELAEMKGADVPVVRLKAFHAGRSASGAI